MAADSTNNYEIDVEDVEYVRHGDKPLLACMFHHAARVRSPLWSSYMAARGVLATG
jgi:hypothetical protein